MRCVAASLAATALALPALAWADAPAPDCEQLAAEVARVEQSRRKAADDADNAWKAVVPFVVLARKAGAKSALEEADKRLAGLKAQARSQHCTADDDAQ